MLPAFLTALLFAFSAIFGQRAARLFGPLGANAIRLSIACVVLGILTWMIDGIRAQPSLHPAVFPALFISGAVGFGLGDVGLFLAYPRLGARLTILINFSLGTLFAAWGDHWLLDENLTLGQWSGVALVLTGLAIALWPSREAARMSITGLGCAVMAGAGQGFGTTLSGWANHLAEWQHLTIHGISQAFQRSTAGVLTAVLVWAVWRYMIKKADPRAVISDKSPRRKHAGFWMLGAALFGPVIGVSTYQWARLQLPSAVVVAIAATSTLWVIPLARMIDKDQPTGRQVVGTVLAVGGIAVLALV